MHNKDLIRCIGKAADVLETLRNRKEPMTLEVISQATRLKKTTCFRLLQTMSALKFVVQDPTSRSYRLGPMLISLGLSALDMFDLHREAVPMMKKLKNETGETVNLSLLDGNELLIIERFRSNHLYSVNLSVGSRLPLHCTSQGRIILAYLNEQERENILASLQLTKITKKTVCNMNVLRDELVQISRAGYAINREEFEIGIAAVAGPVLNHNGEAAAALNVSFPLARHPEAEFMEVLTEKVLAVCKQLSTSLGYLQ